MKKLIFILLISVSPLFSQERIKTITVIGETENRVEIGRYHLTLSLKQIVPDGYQHLEPKSLLELKQLYNDKLKEIGVDFGKFKENLLLYLYLANSELNDTAYYSYSTTSSDEIQKIIKQRMKGLTVINVEVIAKEKNNEELAVLSNLAIEDAKVVAQKIAKKLNKKLGDIVKVEDSNTKAQYMDTYKFIAPQKYSVTVQFSIE